MCILCVVQRWSRRIATMFPWLLIPLLVFWAMLPFLPPGVRFEITSPRLACVMVLLVTLFWYEILMPQLSLWRIRRSARLWERHRALAIELQKLRKTATRRCRNCHTPYREQNPGGGRFMCSYCGHVSKRPVLDLPHLVGGSRSNDFVGKNGWTCSKDWLAEGNTNKVNPVLRYWVADDHCSMERSCSVVVLFSRSLLCCFFASMRWLCRKVFRFGSREDGSDTDRKGSLCKRGDNGENLQQSRWEKARRKAEEKRQAKLEKEMLEEEERKQREEVARLVEERRRLRDEMLKAEREHLKSSVAERERGSRKEAEKRKNRIRKDKDRGSSKSNSDVDDQEKKISRVSERKHEFDKNENERQDKMRAMTEIPKTHTLETLHGNKVTTGKLRYFGNITGSFLSPSRGFSHSSFFGRNSQNPTSTVNNRANKPTMGSTDHAFETKRDSQVTGDIMFKATSNGDGRIHGTNLYQHVNSRVQPRHATPKKSWDPLQTRPRAVSPYPDSTTSSFQNENGQIEAQSAHLLDQKSLPNYCFDNQINFTQPLPCVSITSANGAFGSTSISGFSAESLFPSIMDPEPSSIAEEAECFKDPCYVPDPMSLLGPVYEALDNFPLDLGDSFLSNNKVEEPQILTNALASGNVAKPSPIESPVSRLQVSEKHTAFGIVSCISMSQDSHTMNEDDSQGTWQMWETRLPQDSLGFVGGSSSWLLPIGQNKFRQEEISNLISDSSITSQSTNESHALLGTECPQHILDGNLQNGMTYSPHVASDPWTPLQAFPVDGVYHFLPHSLIDNMQHIDTTDISPIKSTPDCSFELSPMSCWFSPLSVCSKEWPLGGPQEDKINDLAKQNIGGSLNGQEMNSVWSFSQKETIQNITETMSMKANALTSSEEI